ncbi:formyltetrahydrofolate-dependent phosphoribosylglycinamide formyltransferase [Desulfonatronum thiosulfatophilum]|uniref:Phosphoribosylglycinamide formyltransferase n=1 Tax=Desulfonatronum thiosulfatophilum TaxID=617002 RepID=A0A1G6AGJ9_9BACT|nr:phosphoribosylglycinamide formyltransferase [Desulfonatronum thiosulfatophilum]SDB07552.1 formyltetrahydrofolate-dependent phosphoribosylglycinamide formyltransferase [Desulfonatronum thiosulfatophilum]
MTLPLGVLISGGGSNLQSLIDRMEAGVLDATIRTVISNNPTAKGLDRAKRHGIPTRVLPHQDYPDRREYDLALTRALQDAGVRAVALAGFMRLVGPDLLAAFPWRVLNIHPALLPSFPGLHAQEQGAAYGVRLAGCTVHFVDEKVDHGPVIIQAAVPALAEDTGETLGQRILRLEHRIYPQAVQWLAQGRLEVQGRQVVVRPNGHPPAALDSLPPCLVHPPLEEGF